MSLKNVGSTHTADTTDTKPTPAEQEIPFNQGKMQRKWNEKDISDVLQKLLEIGCQCHMIMTFYRPSVHHCNI